MVFNRNDDGFQQHSFISILLMPFRAVQDWLGDAISGDDRGFRDGGSFSAVRLITLPFRLLGGFIVFMVQAWTTSRDGIAFLRGLPAFAIFAMTPMLLWGLTNYSKQISLGPTLGYHQMHVRNGSFDHAQLFSRKLVELNPESKRFKYLLADDIEKDGDPDHATRIMTYLAGDFGEKKPAATENGNVDDPAASATLVTEEENDEEPAQFSDAHVWLAQKLIKQQRIEGFDEERNTQAMKHLRAAIDTNPENIRAQVNLVDLYVTKAQSLAPEEGEPNSQDYNDNLALARESLEALTSFENFTRMEQVMAMPQLVDVCVKLGDDVAARRALNEASSKVIRIARLNPEIYEIWFSLVRCAVALKDYDRANEFIKTGYQNVKTQDTRRKIMQLASLVYIQNADDFKDLSQEQQFRKRLFALCKAIATNPKDVKIYDRLVDYIDVDVEQEKRDVWLRNSILECPIPGVIHILIGTRELLRGDVVAGKTSWDIAQHQFGTTEFVTHRLLSVAIRKRPEFGDGDLLDTALLLFPDQYMLYETRGAIKKKNQKYQEAIQDFKVVLEKVPDLITVHKHLADCYEALGQASEAEHHRLRVRELLEKIDEKERELYEKVLNSM